MEARERAERRDDGNRNDDAAGGAGSAVAGGRGEGSKRGRSWAIDESYY